MSRPGYCHCLLPGNGSVVRHIRHASTVGVNSFVPLIGFRASDKDHCSQPRDQHLLIKELDIALWALITDLEHRGILDKTLIAIGTEFGRPAACDGRGGRGHQGSCFSLLLAGGGLKYQGAYDVTDELSRKIVETPASVPDFHATIHATTGINPAEELFDDSRPVPITDQGKPVEALFG